MLSEGVVRQRLHDISIWILQSAFGFNLSWWEWFLQIHLLKKAVFCTCITLHYQTQQWVWEHCVFAQSLPLSILLGCGQPNPSALCRQPTHHIQMALWPTHTAGPPYGDYLLPYKRHFVSMGAAYRFQRLFMCQVEGGDTLFSCSLKFKHERATHWRLSLPSWLLRASQVGFL